MPFELPTVTPVAFTNSNPRSEFHGEEHVRAIDISMTIEGGNSLLDTIELGLRAHHYFDREADAGQQSLNDALAHLPNLRFPHLPERVQYAKGEKWRGYRFVIDYGLDEHAVDLTDCVLSSLWYEMQEGGSVTVGFTVQYNGRQLESDALYGRLAGLTPMGEGHVQLLPMAALLPVRKGWRSGVADASATTDGAGKLFDGEEDGEAEEHPQGEFAEGSPEAALLDSVQSVHEDGDAMTITATLPKRRGKRAAARAPLQ